MIVFYDTIARFYDAENATYDDDMALYEALLDDLGRENALVVGCGTGRVLLALARLGCRVTGIDLSAPMLARVERHLDEQPDLRDRVTLVHGDARAMPVGGRFKLITVPYNTFMHFLEQADQLAVLRACRRLLADDACWCSICPTRPTPTARRTRTGCWCWSAPSSSRKAATR